MKQHLSDEQFNQWVLGEAENAVGQHLETCEACRHEAEELKETLSGFRESIQAAAQRRKLTWREPAQAPATRGFWAGLMAQRWAFAGALAAIIAVVVVLLRVDYRRTPHTTTGTVGEDEILMQIQTDVNQRVPSALAPGELLLKEAEEAPSPVPEKAAPKTRKPKGGDGHGHGQESPTTPNRNGTV